MAVELVDDVDPVLWPVTSWFANSRSFHAEDPGKLAPVVHLHLHAAEAEHALVVVDLKWIPAGGLHAGHANREQPTLRQRGSGACRGRSGASGLPGPCRSGPN